MVYIVWNFHSKLWYARKQQGVFFGTQCMCIFVMKMSCMMKGDSSSCQVINFFNRAIMFLIVRQLQFYVVNPLLLNASLLIILTTGWLQWLISAGHWTYWQSTMTEYYEFWWLCDWIMLNWFIKLICWFYPISEIKFLNLKQWTIVVFLSCFRWNF